jgi:hypothetical protein
MELCYILHPNRNDVDDDSGCLKKSGHNDSHICKTKNGEYVEWEDDYTCKCGCWDDLDDSPCGVYSVISKKEALEKIKEKSD